MYFSILHQLLPANDEDADPMPNRSQDLCKKWCLIWFSNSKISKSYHLFSWNIPWLCTPALLLLFDLNFPYIFFNSLFDSVLQIDDRIIFFSVFVVLDFICLWSYLLKDVWHLISGYSMDLGLLISFPNCDSLCCCPDYLGYRKSHYLNTSFS